MTISGGILDRAPGTAPWKEPLCFRELLAFFSHRIIRGGPRLLLHLTACLVLLIVLMQFMPQGLSDVSSTTYEIWRWTTDGEDAVLSPQPSEKPLDSSRFNLEEENDGVGGGLRIVVFGANDIATPVHRRGSEREEAFGWTEALCVELNCTTYLSLTPTVSNSVRSLTSNSLYATALETALNSTSSSNAPSPNYTFLETSFPTPDDLPDLESQVNKFLSLPRSAVAPKETLWVFSFGAWDVWSLAAFPSDIGRRATEGLVEHLFAQVERLYQAAVDPASVAWSNVTNDLVFRSGANGLVYDATAEARHETNPNRTEIFRVLVPKLFDPSLTPAWKKDRPAVPKPHNKPEQARNAARLTDLWNSKLDNAMSAWVKTLTPEEQKRKDKEDAEKKVKDDEYHKKKIEELKAQQQQNMQKSGTGKAAAVGTNNAAAAAGADGNTKPFDMTQLDGLGEDIKHAIAAIMAPQVEPPETTTKTTVQTSTTTSPPTGTAVSVEASENQPAPWVWPLQRDGINYDMSDYLLEVMVERQFRNAHLTDANGVGQKPIEQGFVDVSDPCAAGNGFLDGVSVIDADDEDWEGEDEDENEVDPGLRTKRRQQPAPPIPILGKRVLNRPQTPATTARHPVASNTVSSPPRANGTVRAVCSAPDNHLFATPYTLSSRAIAIIGHQAASMMLRNETLRARWAGINLPDLKQQPNTAKGRPAVKPNQ